MTVRVIGSTSAGVQPDSLFTAAAQGNNLQAINNANIPAAVIDAAGPFGNGLITSSPEAHTQPNFVVLPNGNIGVFTRYANPGSAASGIGVIKFTVYDTSGNIVVAPVLVCQDTTNSTPLSYNQMYATVLQDGRMLLIYCTVPQPAFAPAGYGGDPIGMNGYNGYVNPDGQPGNILYMFGAISGNTITWDGVQKTLVTGFAPSPTTVGSGSNGGQISLVATWSSPSAGVLSTGTLPGGFPSAGVCIVATSSGTALVSYTGVSGNSLTGCAYITGSAAGTVSTGGVISVGFDNTGIQPAWEPVTGTLVFMVCGSNVGPTWPIPLVATPGFPIAYVTMTYSPGGPLTVNPITSGTTFPGLTNFILNEHSIAPTGLSPTNSIPTGFLLKCRDNTNVQGLQTTATGTVAQLIAGTLTWSTPTVSNTIGSATTGADQCLYWDQSGRIMHLSRLSAAAPTGLSPYLAGNQPVFVVTSNGGVSWNSQVGDIFSVTGGQFISNMQYGNIVACPGNPGVVLAGYCAVMANPLTYQIRLRSIFLGAGVSPQGSIGATSVVAGAGNFQQATIGNLTFPAPGPIAATTLAQTAPGRLNPIALVPPAESSLGVLGQGIYAGIAPPPDVADMPILASGSKAIKWQDGSLRNLQDSAVAGPTYTPGVLYLKRITINNLQIQKISMLTGTTAGATITNCFAGIYTVSNNPALLFGSTNAITTLPAATVTDFILAAITALPAGTSGLYLGWLFVGTTSPSWKGDSIDLAYSAESPNQPLLGTGAATGLTALPSLAGAVTPIGGVSPRVQLN